MNLVILGNDFLRLCPGFANELFHILSRDLIDTPNARACFISSFLLGHS